MASAPLFARRYRLENQLAHGELAEVYRATDCATGNVVVLKIDRGEASSVQHEVRAADGIHHPHLAGVIDRGVSDHRHYFVQAWIEGQPLSEKSRPAEPTEQAAWLRWAGNVASALAALHGRRVVHGDVKPTNIVIGASGATLIDLGLAGQVGERLRGGTPEYLSPDARANNLLAFANDVFAFGRTFEPILSSLRISDAVRANVLASACDPDPARRPHAQELCDALSAQVESRTARFLGVALNRSDLLREISRALDSSPCVVLTGPSGAGKTSALATWKQSVCFERETFEKPTTESLFDFFDRIAGFRVRGILDFPKFWRSFSTPVPATFVLDAVDRWTDDERELLRTWIASAPGGARFVGTAEHTTGFSCEEMPIGPLTASLVAPFLELFPEQRAELKARVTRAEPFWPHELRRLLAPNSRDAEPTAASSSEATAVPREELPDLDAVDLDPFAFRARALRASTRTPEELLFKSHYALRTGNIQAALALSLRALRRAPHPLRDRIRLTLLEIDARLGSARGLRTLTRIPEGSPFRFRAELEAALILLKLSRFSESIAMLRHLAPGHTSARWTLDRTTTLILAESWSGMDHMPNDIPLRDDTDPEDPIPPRTRFRALHAKAILAQQREQLDDAERFYRAATDLAEQEHLSDLLVSSHTSLASLHHSRGQLGFALAGYRDAERFAIEFANPHALAVIRQNVTGLLLELGAFDEVRRRLEQQDPARLETLAPLQRAQWWSASAEVALASGDFARASDAAGIAYEICQASGSRFETEEAHLLVGLVALRAGRVTVDDLVEWNVSSVGERGLRARYARFHSTAFAASQRFADALRTGKEALSEFEAIGDRSEMARTETLLARVYAEAGADELAADARHRARRIWEETLATLEEPYRSLFRSHPDRADAWTASRSDQRVDPSRDTNDSLFRFVTAVARAESEQEIFRLVLDHCVREFDVERAFVLRVSAKGQTTVALSKNIDKEEIRKAKHKFSRSLAERSIRSGEAYLSGNAMLDDPRNTARSVHLMHLRSVLVVPLRDRDISIGALYLDNRFKDNAFSEGDRKSALHIADFASACVARLHAIDELRRLRDQRHEEKAPIDGAGSPEAATIDALSVSPFPEFVTSAPAVLTVLQSVQRIADTDVPILVRGESGTGKERIARLIHDHSHRAREPFVAINCAAMPEALLEAELFGYKRGAFTGASQDKRGLFVTASNGTLFLDELGELPLPMQAKLLRVLQEKEVRPLGGEETVSVNARIVCATNRTLTDEVAAGRFREDLFYRIAVIDLLVPPLRERREDIPLLIRHVLDRLNRENDKEISIDRKAMARLLQHAWPGNVRELENSLRRGFVLSDGVTIRAGDLMLDATELAAKRVGTDERAWLLDALKKAQWNAQQTARALGIPRASFYRKLRKHGIVRPGE